MKFVNGLVVNEANVLHLLAHLCLSVFVGKQQGHLKRCNLKDHLNKKVMRLYVAKILEILDCYLLVTSHLCLKFHNEKSWILVESGVTSHINNFGNQIFRILNSEQISKNIINYLW